MKIALDIMSGDKAPNCNINGAIKYIKNPKSKDTHVVLYGTEQILKNNAKIIKQYPNRISYKITKEIITMDDKPSYAFKNKRNSSLALGREICKKTSCNFLSGYGIRKQTIPLLY